MYNSIFTYIVCYSTILSKARFYATAKPTKGSSRKNQLMSSTVDKGRSYFDFLKIQKSGIYDWIEVKIIRPKLKRHFSLLGDFA